MKMKHDKLQVTDKKAIVRKQLKDIAKHHVLHNPNNLPAETIRLLGVHSGIRAALLLCIDKELASIAAHNELTNPPT